MATLDVTIVTVGIDTLSGEGVCRIPLVTTAPPLVAIVVPPRMRAA